jgi:hypothetical protein
MAETLEKLRPDRDLQCYFQQPSAVAALSEATPTGFTISGSWRQQYDWAVLEWNRDNGFEHPAFRYLPDGDLSGLELTYDETRTNCIAMDCNLGDTVGWPYLRIWQDGAIEPDLVPLLQYATPIEGTPAAASATLTLTETPTVGDFIGVAWLDTQYNYQVQPSDSIESAVRHLAEAIDGCPTMSATASGAQITLTAKNTDANWDANWNRACAYGFVSGTRTEVWTPWWVRFSGGASPTKWRVHLDFDNLTNTEHNVVPVTSVRKMRWTYAAGWQDGAFERTEFEVQVSNWRMTGTNRTYQVAGPGSRRIEDDAPEISYSGTWTGEGPYNYSKGSYHWTQTSGDQLTCAYSASAPHVLYLGAEFADNGADVSVTVDSGTPATVKLRTPLEDALVRIPLGQLGAGTHTVTVQHAGPDNDRILIFDFLEIAIPSPQLPVIDPIPQVSLATDWDTYHSICLAPERTAWMIYAMGFRGRVNHYVGALWFYELVGARFAYASAQIHFTGPAQFGPGEQTSVVIGRDNDPLNLTTTITHLHYIGDTVETVTKALEMEINRGSMSIRAQAQGTVLTIYSRSLGKDSEHITVAASSTSLAPEVSSPTLAGGADGDWRTDLEATPRVNRAARDWARSFFVALKAHGLDGVASLSMELGNGDPSPDAGIAQRCPGGEAVVVSTPALQTNFSPASTAFWQQAYRDLAQVMTDAGMQPYLQFGEVQWWYMRDHRTGMPFYDAYTESAFHAAYGRDMRVILENTVSPADYPEETQFLPTLIGQFTNQVMAYVRSLFPTCRFEVLYPLDVNETAFNSTINYPASDWTPEKLDCLKTESFGYTYGRNLDKCRTSVLLPQTRGFPLAKCAHLTGIGDPTSPWPKEVRIARAAGVESVVLWALDQLCLIGYTVPLPRGLRRAVFEG